MEDDVKKDDGNIRRDNFIKCSKGHVYESGLDECPYCNGKKLENALEKLLVKDPKSLKKLLEDDMAMCYLIG